MHFGSPPCKCGHVENIRRRGEISRLGIVPSIVFVPLCDVEKLIEVETFSAYRLAALYVVIQTDRKYYKER